MRHVLLILIAIACAVLQYSWMEPSVYAPRLLLALAAWGMVDGSEEGMIPRAWAIGLIADWFDPGSLVFHSLAYLGLALLYVPIRAWIFRSHMTGWASWAMIATMLVCLTDGWISGFGDATVGSILVQAILTALVTVAVGWLLRGLPPTMQPIGRGGA